MKKITLALLCLALTSLACLQTAVVAQDIKVTTSPTFVKVQVLVAEPTSTEVATAAAEGQICARVVAIEALHLRTGANEHAIVLTWLKNGDVVQVIDQSDGDWWFVESSTGRSGYARSVYLQESECE